MSTLTDLGADYARATQRQVDEQNRIDILRRNRASLEDRTVALLEELTATQAELRDTDHALDSAHRDKALADVRAAILAERIDRVKDVQLGTTAATTDTDN